jgi:tRNA(Ile)-lysidine synthetase-like protein
MKNLSPIAYRSLFFKHLWRFLQQITTPEELSHPHAIAVSGGIDSMTLLWVAKILHDQGKIGPIRALFVHHGTRECQDLDQAVVERFCRSEKIPFKVLKAKGLNEFTSNFEARARGARQSLILGELSPKELIWCGHQIDDSFEWGLMQRSRSTNPKAVIGIPVRNGPIVRPFHCVTRKQIRRLARFEGIPFRNDPTNRDLKFDRNFVRHKIAPLIRQRFPRFLKQYVHISNFAAMNMGISFLTKAGPAKIYAYDNGAVLQGFHFSEIQIQEIIHSYSEVDRGELITPIQRMLRAIDNRKKGPFQFSGGVNAYYTSGLLTVYCSRNSNHDQSVAKVLQSLSPLELMQLPTYKRIELEHNWINLLNSPDAMNNMPGLVVVLESDSICKTLNCSVFDPLWPHVSQVCKNRGFRFTTMVKCIETWKNKGEKLPERLKLLPLSNLANLFSSQE